MKKEQVAIVGSGLVGSLLAVLLRKQGYAVNLYEKRSDPRRASEEKGRSINLVITSRGLCGLERAGLLSEVMNFTVPVFGRMMHSKAGETKYQPYGRENECNYSVSRAQLNNFLLDAAEKQGARLFFEHKLENVDFDSRKLNFSDNTAVYDILFGADGAGSAVRKSMSEYFRDDKGFEKVDWLEADYKELMMPAGPGGKHRLEKNALHIWPRGSHMLMALANEDGSFTATLYLRKSGPLSFDEVKTSDEVKNLFQSEFPDAIPHMPNYVEEFGQNPQGHLGTVHCSRWGVGNAAALIGDAAHAIIPFFGQGMNCGFEDCDVLMDLLQEKNGDWAMTLEAYSEIRRPDTEAIAAMALENWDEMKGKVADQNFLLRKKVEGWLEERFPQYYKSRYGMVTYTLIPYSLALKAGHVQNRILDGLCRGISSPEEISEAGAREILEKEFVPFLRENKIDLRRYQPKI